MTTTPSPTPSPTLPVNWAPTASGCLRKNDLWIWQFSDIELDARTVLGGPSQTNDCFATEWTATQTFAGSGCPVHYKPACTGDSGAVTCCPELYDFTCDAETWTLSTTHGPWFRCISQYDSTTIDTLTVTDLISGQLEFQTRTRYTNQHLFALALLYTTPTPSSTGSLPTSSSESSPTETPTQNTSGGLSPAAAGGIGAGVGAAAILLGLLGWFLYRRKRAANITPQTPGSSNAYPYSPSGPGGHPQYLTQPLVSPAPKQPPPKELPGESMPVFELPVDGHGQHNR